MTLIQTRNTYPQQFEDAERRRAGLPSPSWVSAVRRDAIARFQEIGFPDTRQEEWRFTNVAPIADLMFEIDPPSAPFEATGLDEFRFADAAWSELVFVNGRYAPALSRLGAMDAQVRLGSLASILANGAGPLRDHLTRYARYEGHAFRALNTAFIDDGAVLQIPANVEVADPIHLLFFSDPSDPAGRPLMSNPRVLIVAGPNSRARIVESYAGSARARYFTNAVTELAIGPGAVVDHVRLQRESVQAFHVSTTEVRLARDSRFSSNSVTIGGGLVRNDVNVVMDGQGVDCTLHGVYLAGGDRLVDNHTMIDHATPNCVSHEIYKGILGGRAKGVFNGKIFVRPDAQKTDAKQTNKVLLLSDDAQINTKPQLEIFADDVKCTHGAAVGQLDEDSLFYLRSRGIDREAARKMLIYAFAGDIVGRINLDPVRTKLDTVLLSELAEGELVVNP
jgi:Fe-S cluster assembly protein SufD